MLARQGHSASRGVYSCRSAVVGSTPLARKAGKNPATPAAKARTTAEPMNVNGSRGFNPKSWLRIRLARASASEKPAARPDPSKALIDDSAFVRSHVLRGEGTPGDDRNTERSKIVRADVVENRLFLDRHSFEILAQDRILPCIALQKRHRGESNRRNTGHGLQVDVQTFIERPGHFVGFSVERRVDCECKKMIGGEPRSHAPEVAQSTNEKACTDQ